MDPQNQNQYPNQQPGGVINPPAQQVPQQPAPQPQPTPTPQPPAPSPQPQQPTPAPQPQAPQSKQPAVKHVQPPKNKKGVSTTQNALQIAEIRDGIVIMNDGSFRSVILTKSINFDLMSPEERESVEFAYQGFLNSLYFPIQIFMRSQKVDLRPYVQKLDKLRAEQENMLLALLMDDYIQYMEILAQEANIMDKQFYVVVPFYTEASAQHALDQSKKLLGGLFSKKDDTVITINDADLEKAKTELKNRVQAVLSGLLQFGVQAIPLDTEELIELYYDMYNPDTATRQQISDFGSINAQMITRGQGEAPQPQLDREIG